MPKPPALPERCFPVVESVIPSEGIAAEATEITIYGSFASSFSASLVALVHVGPFLCTNVEVISETEITALIPRCDCPGFHDVIVTVSIWSTVFQRCHNQLRTQICGNSSAALLTNRHKCLFEYTEPTAAEGLSPACQNCEVRPQRVLAQNVEVRVGFPLNFE
jgi:hypothetical protein